MGTRALCASPGTVFQGTIPRKLLTEEVKWIPGAGAADKDAEAAQNNDPNSLSPNSLPFRCQKHHPNQEQDSRIFRSALLPAVPAPDPGHGFKASRPLHGSQQCPSALNITPSLFRPLWNDLCTWSVPRGADLPVSIAEAQGRISLQGLPHHSHAIGQPIQATSVEAKSTIGHVPATGPEDDAGIRSRAIHAQSCSHPGALHGHLML